MNRYKILMICQIDLSLKLAQTVHWTEIFKHLLEMGHDCYCIAPNYGNKGLIKGNILYLRNFNLKYLKNIIYQLKLLFVIPYLLIKNKYQIVYIRYASGCLIPAIWSKIFNIRYVTELNGDLAEELEILYHPSQFVINFVSLIEKWNHRLSDCVITVTDGIKEYLIQKYLIPENKIEVIQNGVNTQIFKPMDSIEVRKKLNLTIDKKYVGWVGSVSPWQALDQLIQIAIDLVKEIPNIEFLIVGPTKDAEEFEKLKKLIQKNNLEIFFRFIGGVDNSEIPYWINAFDVCCIFSRHIKKGRSPVKIYEYLACGKPVLGVNVPGIGDLIEKLSAGINLDLNQWPMQLSECVKIIKNESTLNKLEQKYILIINEEYSWMKAATRTCLIMDHLMEDRIVTHE